MLAPELGLIGTPKFGWRKLKNYSNDSERQVSTTLIVDLGVSLEVAGKRFQDYDLEIFSNGWPADGSNPYLTHVALMPGKYEIKSLWRKNENSAFDRRFKVGRRGERIYGRRDAEIKSFALGLDRLIEDGLYSGGREFVEASHSFIDQALERRHSKLFSARLRNIAKGGLTLPGLYRQAQSVLDGGINGADISRGFEGITGIFFVAGELFTMITRDELQYFVTFDSATAEGPKLRLLGKIPNEKLNSKSRKATK